MLVSHCSYCGSSSLFWLQRWPCRCSSKLSAIVMEACGLNKSLERRMVQHLTCDERGMFCSPAQKNGKRSDNVTWTGEIAALSIQLWDILKHLVPETYNFQPGMTYQKHRNGSNKLFPTASTHCLTQRFPWAAAVADDLFAFSFQHLQVRSGLGQLMAGLIL